MNVFASDVCASKTFGLRVCQKASEPFHGRKRWVIDPRRNDLDVLHTPTFGFLSKVGEAKFFPVSRDEILKADTSPSAASEALE